MGGVAPLRIEPEFRGLLKWPTRRSMPVSGVGVIIFCFCLLSIMVSLAWMREFLRELPLSDHRHPSRIETQTGGSGIK